MTTGGTMSGERKAEVSAAFPGKLPRARPTAAAVPIVTDRTVVSTAKMRLVRRLVRISAWETSRSNQ